MEMALGRSDNHDLCARGPGSMADGILELGPEFAVEFACRMALAVRPGSLGGKGCSQKG
jgi:hypothetical protein